MDIREKYQDGDDSLVEGRNAVAELLKSNRSINKLFVAENAHGRMMDILSLARQAGVPVIRCDRRKLDAMSVTQIRTGAVSALASRALARPDS